MAFAIDENGARILAEPINLSVVEINNSRSVNVNELLAEMCLNRIHLDKDLQYCSLRLLPQHSCIHIDKAIFVF